MEDVNTEASEWMRRSGQNTDGRRQQETEPQQIQGLALENSTTIGFNNLIVFYFIFYKQQEHRNKVFSAFYPRLEKNK
jgi:hypothetical protein